MQSKRIQISDRELKPFLDAIESSNAWWDVKDAAFEKEIRADRKSFAKEFVAALSSGELNDAVRSKTVSPENLWQWNLGIFYLRQRVGWKVGDEMVFGLPGGMAYSVTLIGIDPITPLLDPDRNGDEVRFGWSIRWNPNSVQKVTNA